MDWLSEDIKDKVFRPVVKSDLKDISLDSRLLNVLLEFNGQKTLSDVSRKLRLEISTTTTAVHRLLELGLIEPVSAEAPLLDKRFFEYLKSQLAMAVGPIAEVLIEDEVADMGYSQDQFPGTQAAELIDLLAREIQREDKKSLFKLNMVNKIKMLKTT